MKRYALALAGLALLAAAPSFANTRTYFGFQIGIGGAPPPPRVVFEAPPPMVYEPETRVYIMRDPYEDVDVFRYGSSWYMCEDGYWYRGRSYGGPFFVVDVRSVPRSVFEVPARRWHHYPPGLSQWHSEHGRGGERGHGWGHERGHGRGHDND